MEAQSGSDSASTEASGSKLKLGTFIGVFTPTVLTILGVIMYLRMGWVLGHVGLTGTIAIVILANVITLLTSLSLSALATNMKVGVGGAYYLISRSFGLALGGAIGIPLYLSQTLSLTLYAYGMAESFRFVLPESLLNTQWFLPLVAALIIVLVSAVAGKSTELTLKLQRPIMVLIAASLVSLFVGTFTGTEQITVPEAVPPVEDVPFWAVFAVFFPAVTGILSGVSLSGDLADARKSIPRGVLAAVLIGLVVYLIIPVALELRAGPNLLKQDTLVWLKVAWIPWLILPGLWGAILSSAFGSILSAPRTLQALALDRLAPKIFTRTHEKTGEPVLGLYVSASVALVAVALGDLNVVAEWLTVFFLTTYGALNAVACLETLIGDPSFRPEIKIPWWASFLGAAGCFFAMFAINPMACCVAFLIEIALFSWINRRTLQTTWGDARSGLWMSLTRYGLLQVRTAQFDPRNWRPHILCFSANPQQNIRMLSLCDAFGQQRGIVTVMTLLKGDLDDNPKHLEQQRATNVWLEQNNIQGFSQMATVSNIDAGVITAAQASGFASLDSNTVVFGWSGKDPDVLAKLLTQTRKLSQLEKCTIIYRDVPTRSTNRDLIVWWKGKQHNGDLMLLLAHLLSLAKGWQHTRIVLKSIVNNADIAAEREAEFRSMLEDIRITADVDVLVKPEETSLEEFIQTHSQSGKLVFIGLPVPALGEEGPYAQTLTQLTSGMPSTVLVRNAGPFRGHLV